MNALGLPEFLFFTVLVVAVLFGSKLPEFLQSLVLSKKQFTERRNQVERQMELIDYVSELNNKQ